MADKVMDALNAIASNVESLQVKAGFIDGATYPDGTPVAMVAAVQEFGSEIDVPARTQDLHFKQRKDGTVGNRFVKKGKANFVQAVTIPEHRIVIPPRPFFRKTIWAHEEEWNEKIQNGLKNGESLKDTLSAVGELITGQIVESITQLMDPPIKNATIANRRRRGNKSVKPLVDTKVMIRGVHSEVGEIENEE